MAIELQQNLRLQQQLVMTPQLQMAIKLLQLSRIELVETIREELENNPTLEESDTAEAPEHPEAEEAPETTESYEAKEVSVEESFEDHLDWQQYMDEYSSVGKVYFESEEKESPNYEAFTASRTTLFDHLRWQLLMTLPTAQEETIGSLIIGNLDKYGYLDVSDEEIARMAAAPLSKVEEVLAMMQTFDPPGICARNLGECLMIQARQLGIDNPVVTAIIENHLKDLENKRYPAIAKSLRVEMETLTAAIHLIRQLDPRPGSRYGEEDQIYITPDVYVYREGNDFIVLLNDDDIPQLHINNYYKQAVKRGERLNKDTRAYIRDRLRSAEWLIKSIQQRRRTIYNVMQSIVKFQGDFFDRGISHLRPMVLRDVAEDIGMHESTISRVTTNKYAHTPHGIFELKFFFNSSINRADGQTIASASVQEEMRGIIAQENPRKPFSDKKIAELLSASSGIRIARRTVAKYREMMGILPSSKRKQP